MAMHIYDGSGWKIINQNGGVLTDRGLAIYNSGTWTNVINARVRTSGGWTGFLDNITLNQDNVTATGFDYAQASWGINSSTGYIAFGGDSSGDQYQFCMNTANLGQYQIKVDPTFGSFSFPSASIGTWISCATSSNWTLESTSGENSVDFTASIRNTITQQVIVTEIMSLYAIAEGGI
jgi:hypothetical protein